MIEIISKIIFNSKIIYLPYVACKLNLPAIGVLKTFAMPDNLAF